MTFQARQTNNKTNRPGFFRTVIRSDDAGDFILPTDGLMRQSQVQQGYTLQAVGAAVTVSFTLEDADMAEKNPADVPWGGADTVPGDGTLITVNGVSASAMKLAFAGPSTIYVACM